MSKQLYEDALADVKKLKEIAEDDAKKALIEAVSPRIKDLIEAELLKEANEEFDVDGSEDLILDDGASFLDNGQAAAISQPDEEGKVTLDLDALQVVPTSVGLEMSNESVVNPLINKINSATKLQIESKLFQIGESVDTFLSVGNIVKNTFGYKSNVSKVISEIEDLYEYLQESAGNLHGKGAYEEKLEDLYKKLNKLVEQENMKKKSLFEGDVTLKLTGMPDELDLDSIGVDLIAGDEDEDEEAGSEGGDEDLELGDEESEEGSEEESDDLDLGSDDEDSEVEEEGQMESASLRDNVVVEIDENMLRREIGRMRALRESSETADVQAWGHDAGAVGDGFEDEDMGDPFVDIDLSEVQSADVEEAYGMDQARDKPEYGGSDRSDSNKRGRSLGMDEADDEKDEDKDEQVKESRRRLAHEVRIQTEAKKKAQTAKKQQKEAQKKSHQKQQEAQQNAKQKKRQEAQKAKQESQKQAKQAKKMQEAYAYYAHVFNESVRRTAKLQKVLAESHTEARRNDASPRSMEETTTLRKKLAETNLFNTKLLYCNKLLQNESLTKRQKAEIIERLDEAKSDREVKLVYESLTKALVGTSRPIAEGTQRKVLGSSSQATRPASTVLSEGYEADRWAKLAGIK